VQLPMAAVAGGINKISALTETHAVAGTLASTAGVGALGLGVAAGAGATYLGVSFVKKSRKKLKQLKHDFKLAVDFLRKATAAAAQKCKDEASKMAAAKKLEADRRALLGEEPGDDVSLDAITAANEEYKLLCDMLEELEQYEQFIFTKGYQVLDFMKNFKTLNEVFTLGAMIYGSGALGKAAMAILAAVGVGAAVTNPYVLTFLLVAGALGGMTMGVGSVQFLTGHQRQHGYDEAFLGDDPRVDRDFLAVVDVLYQMRTGKPAEEGPGVQLRAKLQSSLVKAEDQRQTFMQSIAHSEGRYQPRNEYSTDKGYCAPGTLLNGRARAAGSYMKTLLHTRSKAAAEESAKHSYHKKTGREIASMLTDKAPAGQDNTKEFRSRTKFAAAQLHKPVAFAKELMYGEDFRAAKESAKEAAKKALAEGVGESEIKQPS
jgi:hypothetical protein